MAGVEPALLMPDLLPMAGQVEQLICANRDIVEAIQQADAGKLADCMRQRVDAYAKLPDGVGFLIELPVNAAGDNHQAVGHPANTAANDDGFHSPNSVTSHQRRS